jgi:hypothetical protein
MSNLMEIRAKERGELEEEKALSDCDDDEWAARFPAVMASCKQSTTSKITTSIQNQAANLIEWIPGSKAMFVVKPKKAETNPVRYTHQSLNIIDT